MINYLIFAALAATFLVVLIGIITMGRGNEFNQKYGNKLMRLRIGMQAVTLILIMAGLGFGWGAD